MALASEDDNSKIVEIVTVAHADNQKHVDNILVQIWKVILVIKLSFCSSLEHKVSKFGHCFAVDASCDYEVQDRFGQELVI